jgi:two-component system, NtrC family, sensor kinase
LIQAEKMSSLGQLVAGIAHEINNPINFIHGNVSHIKDYTHNLLELVTLYQAEYSQPSNTITNKLDEIDLDFIKGDVSEILTSMNVGTKRIRDIVQSLRVFSRLDEAEVKFVNIHEGIDSALMILQNRFKSTKQHDEIQLIKEYSNLPLIKCYAGQLNQAIMSILVNAIDALEEKMRNVKEVVSVQEAPKIHICTNVINDNWIKIAITDNGIGIPEAIQARLFEPFFTTKPVGKGTGMGLAISYQIVTEKHGGNLFCYSAMGQGTEFVIEIPIQ